MEIALLAGAILLAIIFGSAFVFATMYRKVDQGRAMIVNTMRAEPKVSFTGSLVIPMLYRLERMDISLKTIEINRRGKDGLICNDNIRADISVTFFVRVNKTKEDVLKVAQAIGCERASDQQTVDALFSAKFSEALKTVGKQLDFEDLYKAREHFRDQIIKVIGDDLNGYVLEDAAIDYLEQTPMLELDKNNILDAQGIRKITQLTAAENVLTNELEREEEMKIKKKDVEAKEMILELERQQADAEARQQREVQTVKAREQAETDKIRAEEDLKARQAQIITEQQLGIDSENKQREIEVAGQNRLRALAIEEEKVHKVRQLEQISREREVELQQIAKERELEIEKKQIADVVRERIVVDKTVAEEEERIKELREISEADRMRQVQIINAEAEAEELGVREVKAAEAAETSARHRAQEKLMMAQAELDASEKESQAKIKQAQGTEAEQAADGLARARVMEAQAQAHEQEGLAQARVQQAMAEALEKEGMAKARIDEESGMAQVRIKDADAASEEKQAMVAVNIKIAEAQAITQQGKAEADSIREKHIAEADGLRQKFAAMNEMSDAARAHEEFRAQLEANHDQAIAGIDASKSVAKHQSEVLSSAMQNAKVDIVGGNGDFFNSLLKPMAIGKGIDLGMGKSEVLQKVFDGHLNGDANIMEDLKGIISGVSSQDLSNVSIASYLNKLSKGQLGNAEKTSD
ncbi:SPFH domain-containing protein [Pelagibaculum spongiae]|uniref:Uncharacterized protein n=1 Tax=Pelagibaculum spongiae TaxID=2080658 RepID=A0A2V1GPW2_9GAMM|nr:SPFH domain-containing protein [Pelagibaculum spongiae]PVZ65443.1 hypothetical protein DC094_18350 [Pelagibaculum spongiae]